MSYKRQILMARKSIARRGMVVLWCVLPGVTGTAWRPQPDGPVTTTPVVIAFLPVDRVQMESYAARGIEVTVGSSIGYMASTPGVDPQTTDFIRRDGKDYAIDYIDTLAPSGIAILYVLLLRAPVDTVVSDG